MYRHSSISMNGPVKGLRRTDVRWLPGPKWTGNVKIAEVSANGVKGVGGRDGCIHSTH